MHPRDARLMGSNSRIYDDSYTGMGYSCQAYLVCPDLLQQLSEAVYHSQQGVSRGNRGEGLL